MTSSQSDSQKCSGGTLAGHRREANQHPQVAARTLTAEQELHIQRLICKHRPEQLKLRFALWTRGAVMLLVQQEFGIELPIRTMGEYGMNIGRRFNRVPRCQSRRARRLILS